MLGIFIAVKTFWVDIGIIGLNNIEMFFICSSIVNNIAFIRSLSLFLIDHGSESLKYLLASKEKFITVFKYSFKFCLLISSTKPGILFFKLLINFSSNSFFFFVSKNLLSQFFFIKEKTLWHKLP